MKIVKVSAAIAGVFAVVCAVAATLQAGDAPRIPGAGTGSSTVESIIEGSLEKYDSVLNTLTIRGIDDDKMTLEAVRALKAKDGTRRIPMGMVKQGQKIRVFYVDKGGKKTARDVELVHDAPTIEKSVTEMPGADVPVDIPGAK